MPGMKVKDCPPYHPSPLPKWLLSVYVTDVFSRLEELKSATTSTLGKILKMDSTKRVTKKLAGTGSRTAAWLINVGNEHGQILMSVLTVAEGVGLQRMAQGLMERYRCAGATQPEVLYVDRDCCGKLHTHGRDLFPLGDGLVVRLDIWHFMRRLAAWVSSESHPLYATFMLKLSVCIFRWDEDADALRHTKSLLPNWPRTAGVRLVVQRRLKSSLTSF
ncbi:chemosensory receptor c [Plakobranchus ocellatus]|uniref:Chemosensory receptor c n=1 Tax=Plakobranchus ocellatus TaxID=259542 RepID=A0AAV4DRP5_9GAST|nr:chemosensory receptor c [Plakobranchus ocellatus]